MVPVQDWQFKAVVKVTGNSRRCSSEKLQDGDFSLFYMVSISDWGPNSSSTA